MEARIRRWRSRLRHLSRMSVLVSGHGACNGGGAGEIAHSKEKLRPKRTFVRDCAVPKTGVLPRQSKGRLEEQNRIFRGCARHSILRHVSGVSALASGQGPCKRRGSSEISNNEEQKRTQNTQLSTTLE